MSKATVIFLVIILSSVLAFRFNHFYSNQNHYKDKEIVEFETRVHEEPQFLQGTQKFRVFAPNSTRINIKMIMSPVLEYGDRIKVKGIIVKKDYDGYQYFAINYPDVQIVYSEQNFITTSATFIRRKAKSLYESSLSPTAAGLLTGIIFGGNQGLDDDFLDHLRSTGVVHVIAASGMNVTFVAGGLIFVLSKFFRRQTAIIAAILGMLFYTYISGFDASIVRAAIMAVIAFSASLFGRQNFSLLSLFLTGFLMLFVKPSNIFDIGFQLSFLSTLGILIIKPFFSSVNNLFLSDDVGTTISAQIATFPIIFGVFGQYGILSIVVNGLLLWTVPILMVIGSVGLILGMIFEPFGRLILYFSIPILFIFEQIVNLFGGFGLVWTIQNLSPPVWIGYYLILAGFIAFLNKRRKQEL